MEAGSSTATSAESRELTITRLLDAPRELVFKMWTDPAHLTRWWGPRGYDTTTFTIDLRVGGALRWCMRSSSDGREIWVNGVFREIVTPERLVFTATNEVDDLDTVIAVTFADAAGKTALTMHQTFAKPALEIARGAKLGWNSSFDRLVEYLQDVR